MGEHLTISEVSRLTGLASHTLRFYEQQFPKALHVSRTSGGHRLYEKGHVERLSEILSLVKHQHLSIREARRRMGEEPAEDAAERPIPAATAPATTDAVLAMLGQVMHKLEEVSRHNEHIDGLLQKLVTETSDRGRRTLLRTIDKCRRESRETTRVYERLLAAKPAGCCPLTDPRQPTPRPVAGTGIS